jgi:signal transduction histidine kinase
MQTGEVRIFSKPEQMKEQKNTVLYVDDEEQNLLGFSVVFSGDYYILTARSAAEALEILRNNDVQVVISDQRMPEMSGLEFLSVVNDDFSHIVCIILTAYADSDALIKAVNQGGIYRFLIKPWDELEFRLTIKRAFERYYLQKENRELLDNLTTKNVELLAINNKLTRTKEALQENQEMLKKQNEEYIKLNEELKETIAQLAILKEKAEESDRLKTAFLQNISHEVRTPMNAVIGFASFLKETNLDHKTLIEYSDIIINSSRQLLAIIEDIITISLIETHHQKTRYSVFEIDSLLNELIKILDSLATHKGLVLKISNQDNDRQLLINTDKTKLQQVLVNLINNAIKFTEKGFVEVGYKIEKSIIVFHVKDTGPGISPENHGIIFERFRQAPHSGSVLNSGTGLGLSISKANVELLGGKIWLESEPGNGTTFYFSLPYIPADN